MFGESDSSTAVDSMDFLHISIHKVSLVSIDFFECGEPDKKPIGFFRKSQCLC